MFLPVSLLATAVYTTAVYDALNRPCWTATGTPSRAGCEVLARWGHGATALPTAFVLVGALEGAVHAHVLGRPLVDDDQFVDALVEALLRIALPPSLTAPESSPWPS